MSGLEGKIILNHYRIETFLGQGGMAEVYKVWDTERTAYLALKLLYDDLAQDPVFLRRFRREANTLQNCNILKLCVSTAWSGMIRHSAQELQRRFS